MAHSFYLEQFQQTINEYKDGTLLLLHSCCAVCSSSVIEQLSSKFSVTVFFYNPNIFPREEYILRREQQIRLISLLPAPFGITYIEQDDGYDCFLDHISGYESQPEGGSRCALCFDLRLQATARRAKECAIELFTSTLTVSPHKSAHAVNIAGQLAAEQYGVRWLASDFKKQGGYLRSVKLSEQYNIYRQRYCGCSFSLQRNSAGMEGNEN